MDFINGGFMSAYVKSACQWTSQNLIPSFAKTGLNTVNSYRYYQNGYTTTAGLLCASAALELFARGLDIHFRPMENFMTKGDQYVKKGGYFLAASATLGICATNYIPGTAKAGAAVYLGMALFVSQDLALSRLVRKTATLAHDYIWIPACNRILRPLWNRVVEPLATQIVKGINWTLETFGFLNHPLWATTALLVVAVGGVFAFRALRYSAQHVKI
jgi:hypothetical protein